MGAIPRSGGTVCSRIAEFLLDRHDIAWQPISSDVVDDWKSLVRDGTPYPEGHLRRYSEGLWCGENDCLYLPFFADEPFRVLYVRRDPRACFVSYCRLMHIQPQQAVGHLSAWLKTAQQMEALPDRRCLKLSYRDDVMDIPRLTRMIGAFINVPVNDLDVAEAVESFSTNTVRKRIHDRVEHCLRQIEAMDIQPGDTVFEFHLRRPDGTIQQARVPLRLLEGLKRAADGSPVLSRNVRIQLPDAPVRISGNGDGTIRLVFEDFNQGHVSDRPDPDAWRSMLTADGMQAINRICGDFLDRYGYVA